MRLPALSLLVLLTAATAVAQPVRSAGALERRLDELFDAEAFEDADWGALVVDIETGETLYGRRANGRFVPASTQKVLVTAAALDALGPGFRYETRLYLDGDVVDGTLYGDLIVRGAGDPTLGGRTLGNAREPFRAWARALYAYGITRVTGDVVGDDDIFDDITWGEGWDPEDRPYYYAAEVSGLSYAEGVVEVVVRGTRPGARADVSWTPRFSDYVEIVNQSTTRPRGGSIAEGYARDDGSNVILVTTEVPVARADTEHVTVYNPTRYFVRALRGALRDAGIRVDGEALDGDERPVPPDYATLTEVAVHRSPTLSEIVTVTNTESHNLFAEHLLRTLGAYRYAGGYAPPGSVQAGVDVLYETLDRWDVDTDGLYTVDGSGLSPLNRVTPRALVGVLRAMRAHDDPDVRRAFYQSLAVGGRTGTLERRFQSGAAHGNVRAKTGFISGVRTLAGYVTSTSGRRLAFAFLCNNYSVSTSRVTQAQDAAVEVLAQMVW